MNPIKKLSDNQYYYFFDNKIVFQSYNTIVCIIENYQSGNKPIIKLTEGQPQSKTTEKYLNKFLNLHTDIKSYKNIN